MYIGDLYFTSGVQHLIDTQQIEFQSVMNLVKRHICCDYGDTDPHDIMINENNLNRNTGTVHSSYNLNEYRIWIITSLGDVQTTYTTILLPEEY